MNKEDIPHWYVLDMLTYDKTTGLFHWRKSVGAHKAGEIAGSCKSANGYVRITLAKSSYRAHRLAWFYVHGVWPSQHLDHVNRNRTDNRLENLREVSQQQNTQNMSKRKNSVCKYKGVTPLPYDKTRFVAQIRFDGKQRKLGIFTSQEEAHQAYCEAAREKFGTFFSAG